MKSRLTTLWRNRKAKQFTISNLREAYLKKDERFLKNAYKYGQAYTKRQAIAYLANFPSSKNRTFLYEEMIKVKDSRLHACICNALVEMTENKKDQSFFETTSSAHRKTKRRAISFRDKGRDYLAFLEDMKNGQASTF